MFFIWVRIYLEIPSHLGAKHGHLGPPSHNPSGCRGSHVENMIYYVSCFVHAHNLPCAAGKIFRYIFLIPYQIRIHVYWASFNICLPVVEKCSAHHRNKREDSHATGKVMRILYFSATYSPPRLPLKLMTVALKPPVFVN